MLRIVGIGSPTAATVVVDPHVPLDVTLGGGECPDKLYWRALWQAESLLEVGIHPETGELVTLTLTSIAASHIERATVALPLSRGEGLPRAELEMWPHSRPRYADQFIDEQVELRLLVSASSAVLTLGGVSPPVEEVWSVGRVRLGLDAERSLRVIEVSGLSPEELEMMSTS
ncbi:hypothetical protein ACLESO_10680 [Pyxidicoccus sp. 3LG]